MCRLDGCIFVGQEAAGEFSNHFAKNQNAQLFWKIWENREIYENYCFIRISFADLRTEGNFLFLSNFSFVILIFPVSIYNPFHSCSVIATLFFFIIYSNLQGRSQGMPRNIE